MQRLVGLTFLFLPVFAMADVVVPVEAVKNHVNIRLSADAASEIVGRLQQGDHLPLVSSDDEWIEVEIAGGATGFISAEWVVVLDEAPPVMFADETAAVDGAVSDATDVAIATVEVVEPIDTADLDETMAEKTASQDSDTEIETASESIDDSIQDSVAADEQQDVAPLAEVSEEIGVADVADIEEEEIAVLAADTVESAVEEAANAADTEEPFEVITGEADADVVAPLAETMPTHGPQGLIGPPGPTGPPGPPGAANIEGSVGFLTRFTAPTVGASSQIYDDGNNIGIGTTAPEQRLEVNGNIQIHEQNSSVAGLMITQSDGETGYIMHNRASTLTIGAGSIDRITIDRDGNVGIGVSRPANPLEMASGAHVTAGGVWTNSSSRARKENIAALSAAEALGALAGLEPVRFNYKNDRSESYVGFIAEDVPDLVSMSDRDSLSSMDIVAVLTKVVQEQQKKIDELEARLDQR